MTNNMRVEVMNQLVARLTILSTLAFAAGCTDEASILDQPQKKTGTAAFALEGGGYELGVSIEIFESGADHQADDPVEADSSDIDDDEATLSISLPVGDDYEPELIAWSIRGPGITGTATNLVPANVTFDGFTPATIDIAADDDTPVSMNFTVDTQAVVISFPPGNAVFSSAVTIDDACTPECGLGEVCVNGDPVENTPTCVVECDPGDVAACGNQPELCIEVAGLVDGGFCEPNPG